MNKLTKNGLLITALLLAVLHSSGSTNSTDRIPTLPQVHLPNSTTAGATTTTDIVVTTDSPATEPPTTTPIHLSVQESHQSTTESEHTENKEHHSTSHVQTHHDTAAISSVTGENQVVGGSHLNITGAPTKVVDDKRFSWWKVVVTLVVFCAMAGVILWILKITEKCNGGSEKDEDSSIEEDSYGSGEKINTSKV